MYRKEAVQYIEENKEEFQERLKEGESIEEYCKNMSHSSTWGTKLELEAICKLMDLNVVIHDHSEPIKTYYYNTPIEDFPVMHISQHQI